MPALKVVQPMSPAPRIDALPPSDTWSDTWETHTARTVTHWGCSGAVVNVEGELDASNAGALADHVQHCVGYCEWLVLDLSDVEFIGTAGFWALKMLTDRCADAMVYCAVVPGAAAARLLRICDPGNTLPTAASVAAALPAAQGFGQVR